MLKVTVKVWGIMQSVMKEKKKGCNVLLLCGNYRLLSADLGSLSLDSDPTVN